MHRYQFAHCTQFWRTNTARAPLHPCASLTAGAKVDVANGNAATALFLASQAGHAPVVDLLLVARANTSLPDGVTGHTPVRWGEVQ